jgi:predicted phage terminase large subunit-like protein
MKNLKLEELEQCEQLAARTSLKYYARHIDIPGASIVEDEDCEDFSPVETSLAAHHILLLNKLEEIAKKRNGRLMVFMPPGSAKSTYASVVFPSWYLGRTKDKRLILISYGDTLSRKLGRRTRGMCKNPKFQKFFDCQIGKESSAADQWALTNGSEYMSAGVLAGVTGNRAHGIVIDDPVKGRAEANSEAVSQSTWDAYNDDIKTRLIPGGFVVIIQTRWSEKDLSGRLLPDDWNGESGTIRCSDGQDWEVVCLPAKCESEKDPLGRKVGDYLWPEWFGKDHWAQFESSQITWASLYQQRPSPMEGGLFKPDKIELVEAIPVGTRFVRAWDLAATVGKGDWTVGAKLGITPSKRWIIADIVRFQGSADTVEAALVNSARRDGSTCRVKIPQDPGQAGKAQVAYLTKQLSGFSVTSAPVTGGKVPRAEPFASQVNVGNVMMIKAPWNDALISELRVFPNGKHDDQVDALADAFSSLNVNSFGLFDYIQQQHEKMEAEKNGRTETNTN